MNADRPPLRAVRPSSLQDDLLHDLQAARPALGTPAVRPVPFPATPAATTVPPAAPAPGAARTNPAPATAGPATARPATARPAVGRPESGRIPGAALLPAVEVRMTPLRWSLPRVRLVRGRTGVAFSMGPWRLTVALRAG